MVRNYKRTTDRQKWSEENMRRAVIAVLMDRMGFLRASATYDVPKSTLVRRVKRARDDPDTDSDNDYGKKSLGRFKTVFSKEQEDDLATYVKAMQARLFGITGKELRILAFQLAKRNNIANPFNSEEGMAGQDSLDGFLKRHQDISYRRPEPTSAARAMGFNKVAVNNFFDLLEGIVEKHKITSERIFNVDETGVSTVPKTQSKILSLKGQKQVGCLSSAERGQLVTAEICFSATGMYVPPMLIFARKRLKNELMDGAPAGFWGTCTDNGWITFERFFDWFKSFVEFTKPSIDKPVLLILDGHASHTKNIDVIDYARKHNVVLLCTPPHCTHKLQPLDVAFMKPISTYYSAEVKMWLRDHPGRVVTSFQVASLFGRAYLQAATMLTAINGFRKCGIWPVDRNVFTEADFLAAETTNTEELEDSNYPRTSMELVEPIPSTLGTDVEPQNLVSAVSNTVQEPEVPSAVSIIPLSRPSIVDRPITISNTQDLEQQSTLATQNIILDMPSASSNSDQLLDTSTMSENQTPIASTSTNAHETDNKTPVKQVKRRSFIVSPENIIPIPKEIRNKKRINRKRGKTAILTDSPYKNDLINEKVKKDGKVKKPKPAQKKKAQKKGTVKKRKRQSKVDETSSEDEENDCPCIYCGYMYSQSGEGWVACSSCNGWAHNSCAGVDEEDNDPHICSHCMPD